MKPSTRLERETMQMVGIARQKGKHAQAEEFTQELERQGWHHCPNTTTWARAAMGRPLLDAWLPSDSRAVKERTTLTLPKGAVLVSPGVEFEITSDSAVVLTAYFPH